jgi:hypothetical protein
MVIAEKWAEQRVLMRAYAESRDQTMPTILLHGTELAIGPAGLDVNGPWGIHAADQSAAHVVKQALEDAARRLAGSKGNPPRLLDENQTFEREATGNWAPGAPRVMPRPDPRSAAVADTGGAAGRAQVPTVDGTAPPFGGAAGRAHVPTVEVVAPVSAARVPQAQVATQVPSGGASVAAQRGLRLTRQGYAGGARTALGYTSGAGAQSAIVRLGLAPQVSAKLGRYIDRVVPAEFSIDAHERRALNAVGEYEHMTARAIGQMLDLRDAVAFMEELVKKLEGFGLGDLVEPAEPVGGEPTYRLRR